MDFRIIWHRFFGHGNGPFRISSGRFTPSRVICKKCGATMAEEYKRTPECLRDWRLHQEN